MAEEQVSQVEAQKNNELPEGAVAEPVSVQESVDENAQVHDKLAEFGETDLEHFISKVTSNVYGRQVVRKLLGLDTDKRFFNPEVHTSPQENNIVGQLDHSAFPPKIKGAEDDTKEL